MLYGLVRLGGWVLYGLVRLGGWSNDRREGVRVENMGYEMCKFVYTSREMYLKCSCDAEFAHKSFAMIIYYVLKVPL